MRSLARSITQVAIAQGAAGTTDIVAAPGAGLKIYVVGFYVALSAAGSAKFQEGGATDLSGAIPVGANGPLSAFSPEDNVPVLQTNTPNAKLTLITVTGAALGWLRYFLDS